MSPSFETFHSLKSPGFRYYLGMFWSQMASSDMRIVAQSLLIYRLTGSVALLGVLSLVNAVPGIFLPLVGGVIADRIPKKNIINFSQAGAMLPTLLVAVCLTTGALSSERAGSWWILMVASFINVVTISLGAPARQAIISEMVGTDRIMNAISLRSMGYNILHLGAPALAGVIIDRFGFAFSYYIMTGLSLLGLIFTFFLPTIHVAKPKERRGGFSQLKDGFKYARSEFHIIFMLIFTMVTAILLIAHSRLMPVFADDILKVGATGYGLLLSASAIGAIVGTFVMASLPSKKRGLMVLVDVTALGIALAVFAFSKYWYLSLVAMAFVGLTQPGRMALCNSLVQSYTSREYLGRVMALYTVQEGIASLGGFIAAMVATVIGTPWTVGSFAVCMSLFALGTLIFLPRIRKLD